MIAPIPPFPMAGEVASLGAAMIWACSMSTFRHFGQGFSPTELNLFKSLIAVLCLCVTMLALGLPFPTDRSTVVKLAASGVIGLAVGDSFLFAAISTLGVQLTSASQCLSPLFAAAIAWVVLDETLLPAEILGMMITVSAVAAGIFFRLKDKKIVAHPQTTRGIVFALLSALCNAIGIVIARQAMADVAIAAGTIIRIIPSVLILVVTSVLSRGFSRVGANVSRRQLAPLALASFAGTFVGVTLLSFGTKYAKAGISAALTITYPLWIIPIAHFLLKEPTNWRASVCTLIAIVGIVIMMFGKIL
jgi:drug/metabolite transporter (DMT)-like permease